MLITPQRNHNSFYSLVTLLLLLFLPTTLFALPPLQLYVELTPPGGVLRPEPGRYAGPVKITKPMTIEGDGAVTIDGGGDGSVLTIEANDTVIRGLHIVNSGSSFDKVDAGITLNADNTLIENNRIENTLFGINMLGANENDIRNNSISSKDRPVTQRGDGFRLWNSHDNQVKNNQIYKVRDLYITNSLGNRFEGNHISKSRMAFEFVFSHENEIVANTIENNFSGLVILYSSDLTIRENRIQHLRTYSGSAIAIKESNSVSIEQNTFLNCSVAVSANAPLDPENSLTIKNNNFIYNNIAMYFYGEKGGHLIQNNHFEGNHLDVLASAPPASLYNRWQNNYWDRYSGLDENADGIGDLPYEMYVWSDRLWSDVPMTQFFRGSPMITLLDFVERLTAATDPILMLRDTQPKIGVSKIAIQP